MPLGRTKRPRTITTIEGDPNNPHDNGDAAASAGEQVIVTQRREVKADNPADAIEKLQAMERKSVESVERVEDTSLMTFGKSVMAPGNRIVIFRDTPKLDERTGQSIEGHIDTLRPPYKSTEIEDYLKKTHGGGKYHVAVFGPENDETPIGGRNIEISGFPIIAAPPPSWRRGNDPDDYALGGPHSGFRFLGEGEEDEDTVDRIFKKRMRRMEQEVRVKSLQNDIRKIDGDSDDVGKEKTRESESLRLDMERQRNEHEKQISDLRKQKEIDDLRAAVDQKFDKIMQQIERSKEEGGGATRLIELQNKLEQAKLEQKMEIEKLVLTLKSEPRGNDAMATMLPLIMKSMEASQAAGNRTTEMMMTMMNAMNEQARNSQTLVMGMMNKNSENMLGLISDDRANKNPTNNLRETVGLIRDMSDITGLGGNGEPKGLGDRLLDMVEKVVPEVLDFMQKRQDAGLETTRTELRAASRVLADKLSKDVTDVVARGGNRGAGPRPTQPPQQAPVEVQPQIVSQHVTVVDNTKPAADYVGSPAAVGQEMQGGIITPPVMSDAPQSPTPPANFVIDVNAETKRRTDHVLTILVSEIQIRPGHQQWVEAAIMYLPEDLMEKIVVAETDEELHEAIKPWGSPAMLDSIWNVVNGNEKARGWLVDGLNALKDEYAGEDEEGEEAADGGEK